MVWYGMVWYCVHITTPNKMHCIRVGVCVCICFVCVRASVCAGKINEGATSDNNNMVAAVAAVAVMMVVLFRQNAFPFQ